MLGRQFRRSARPQVLKQLRPGLKAGPPNVPVQVGSQVRVVASVSGFGELGSRFGRIPNRFQARP
jgi:hypothetical protein